jgi:hypothetical protein
MASLKYEDRRTKVWLLERKAAALEEAKRTNRQFERKKDTHSVLSPSAPIARYFFSRYTPPSYPLSSPHLSRHFLLSHSPLPRNISPKLFFPFLLSPSRALPS